MLIYGPFRFADRPLAPSNIAFDEFLRSRDPASGLRDFETLVDLASEAGFGAPEVTAMPANNHLLVFRLRGNPL